MRNVRLLAAATCLVLIGTVALTLAATSGPRINAAQGMTLSGAPLAIHGYDPVAYFTEGRAMLGSAKHTAKHQNAAFRFVSEANKKTFEKSPGRYAPQFGGFCAFGVSVGSKFDGDPQIFKVVDDRLYFNLNPDIRSTWEKDIPGNIVKAENNWTRIKDRLPAEL